MDGLYHTKAATLDIPEFNQLKNLKRIYTNIKNKCTFNIVIQSEIKNFSRTII